MFFDAVKDSPMIQRADVRLCELAPRENLNPTYRWRRNPNQRFNLILIDGPVGEVGRSGFLGHLTGEILESRFAIVIDDTNREAELNLANEITDTLRRSGIPTYWEHNKHNDGRKSFAVIKSQGQNQTQEQE
jgi:hypothetical protein